MASMQSGGVDTASMAGVHQQTQPSAAVEAEIRPIAAAAAAKITAADEGDEDEKAAAVASSSSFFFSSCSGAAGVAAAAAAAAAAASPPAAAAAAASPSSSVFRSGSSRVTLVRTRKDDKKLKDTYEPVRGSKFENNIYRAVGFLELANAGDFAANVWNQTPVPVYAVIFMALGGTVAGFMSLYAFMDSRLAWRNTQFLRQQRRDLAAERARRVRAGEPTREVDVLLAVSYREVGSEFLNRYLLDLFMGCGAVLICIGTYMAIGGANHNVWLASNILSGYLGNAPIALFGLLNSAWAAFIFCKAQGHVNAADKVIAGTRSMALIKRRSRNVQTYAVINGTATIMGGVGSMVTATRWWGYVVLIPVIVSSVFCNYWWRLRVGYTRRDLLGAAIPEMTIDELSTALEFAARAEIKIKEHAAAPLSPFVPSPASLRSVVAFLQEHELLEAFAVRLVSDPNLRPGLCGGSKDAAQIDLDVATILATPEDLHPAMINVAEDLLRATGSKHFKHRERYAAELLGTYLALSLHEASPAAVAAEIRGEKA